jgi:hypothetical protein
MGTQSNYALRLPLSLKAGAELVAREDGTTLNQFIVSAVAEKLSAMKTADYFTQRAQRGDMDAALAFLSRQGGQTPENDDVLPS